MTSTSIPPFSVNFTDQDEHADAVKFANALRPPPSGLYTFQRFCSAITPHSSCLDVLLFRGILLVAYAASDEVVIARATDLRAVKRLHAPNFSADNNSLSPDVTALSFRERDGAIAAAFGTTLVVFCGWSSAAKERDVVYHSDFTEVIIETAELGVHTPIISLSWDSTGTTLCAVSDCISIWKIDSDRLPVRYTVSVHINRDRIPTHPLALGSISPDGSYVVASGLYARVAHVWDLTRKLDSTHSVAEIVHGRSGIATLDWKRRGGGNEALMTCDRDGTIRIWVRASLSRLASRGSNVRASGIESWMEEIARSPHVERTPRAGAAFLAWGGGGGAADDEGDAKATNATHPFLANGIAPKPSRCHHWIVRAAGGDARAWRVRGLDDRPRAEFTRLEPGTGEALLGVEDGTDEEPSQELPLKDMSIVALRAVSPIPLTTETQYKVGLVKSYAISNGERRLRSPEPPDPPNLAAIFILAVQNGLSFLARYDISPTSSAPAICRARIGLGHISPVVELTTSVQSSSSMLESGGWLASRGESGDVLLWRTNVYTGAWEPMRIVAVVPGPHTAVAFAPPRTSSPNRWEVGVFTCDAAMGSLRLFNFVNFVSRYDNSAGQDVQFAKQVSVCHTTDRSLSDSITQLCVVRLASGDCDETVSSAVAVFGIRQSGRMSAWWVGRYHRDAISIEPSLVRFIGKRHDGVTSVASGSLTNLGCEILVCGTNDGSMFIYAAGSSESKVEHLGDDFGDSEEDDDEGEEGVIWLRELSHLQSEQFRFGAVVKVEVMGGASRILALHTSGASVVWHRVSTGSMTWEAEMVIPGDRRPSSLSLKTKLPSKLLSETSDKSATNTSSTIGYDRDGNFSVVAVRENSHFDRYRRVLGHPWELVHRDEEPQDELRQGRHSAVHIGKGVIVCSNGRGLSVLGTSTSISNSLSYSSDAGGYSPSNAFVAQLLTGARAWQVSASLIELHNFIHTVTKRNASETYSAGRGLIPPPPPLKILLSSRDHERDENVGSESDSQANVSNESSQPSLNGFKLGAGKNLFLRLMAKSESGTIETLSSGDGDDIESRSGSKGDLSRLSNRLRVVSLAGMTRIEQSVLAAISRACSALKTTLDSLDPCGARFALLAQSHLELIKTPVLPLSIVANAVHSSSRDALMDIFLSTTANNSRTNETESLKMWDRARALGAGWWVSTTSECKKLAERIARADFTANRNPDDAALWYIALGRRTTLAALYKSQQNTRMAKFLLRNFNETENKTAASKNAYVLLSKHRLELAVAFFILSGNIEGAMSLVRTRIKDDQLAIFLSRLVGDEKEIQTSLGSVIERKSDDDHGRSIALWLAGEHDKSIDVASKASRKAGMDKQNEFDACLSGCLPDAVHAVAHVLAIASCPPLLGTKHAKDVVTDCRRKAVRALLGDGCPSAALMVSFELIRFEGDESLGPEAKSYSRRLAETTLGSAFLASVDTLKGRAVCYSGAVRAGAVDEKLKILILRDIKDLEKSALGLERTIAAVECASFELMKEDEVDCAIAATYAALDILRNDTVIDRTLVRKIEAAQRNILRMAVSKALLYVQGTLSLLHHPNISKHRLSELLAKYVLAISHIEHSATPRGDLFRRLVLEFKGSVFALRFGLMFLRGDWPGVLHTLRACDAAWVVSEWTVEDLRTERVGEDDRSTNSCSTMAPDAISIEALRHVASNPAVLRISRNLGHNRRNRKAPSMAIVGAAGTSVAAITDETITAPTLAVSADDPFAFIRIHPALSSTLASAAAAYLAAHLAAQAAAYAKFASSDASQRHRNSELFWQTDSGQGHDQSFRLIKASESLEQLAEDAIARWVPLQKFGVEADEESLSHQDEAAGAFVDLWSTLGCLPEYAPSLSEAATVAAAEMAAAASRAAIQAAEQKDGGRRRRRRREREGGVVANAAKEGLKLFDTTSADSLHGAYPVRFSASAQGPWSGRGRHATLYSEDRSLFRTLCVSSTDPPAVVVATPKGIQEIVPSSYTTMPAGFRSHYASKRRSKLLEGRDHRLEALALDRAADAQNVGEDEDVFLNSYDGFGEGPYVALDLSSSGTAGRSLKRMSEDRNRKAVWRHQVHATTLASHPLRRRFASGGTDGVVRLWDFADPISLASFREGNYGRISQVAFSGYGNTMLAVYSSGYVTIWDDPDTYSWHPRERRGARGSRAKVVRAFDHRNASGATFLDERHTIAVVGDPTAPPSVGHSLRIFDTREQHSSLHATWSAAVNHQFEARCVTLLEDRMRVVTGGLDGSLSIVDLRSKGCIAELPAHSDEVTCVALESPRGRALVSGCSNGEIRLWDSRTLLCLDALPVAHTPTRHYWSGNGFGGLVGSYGTQGLALTDRSLISCGGDGMVKIWGPGWSDFDLNVL